MSRTERGRQAVHRRETDWMEQNLAFFVLQLSASSCPDAPFWKRGWCSEMHGQ